MKGRIKEDKNFLTYPEFQEIQSKDKVKSYEIPGRPWESLKADIFTIDNEHYVCIVDYNNKFPVIKQVEGFNTDNLIKILKIIFSESRLPSKIVSDAGTSILSDMVKSFCRRLGIWHAASSSYNHQSNGQEEASIKFVRRATKIQWN